METNKPDMVIGVDLGMTCKSLSDGCIDWRRPHLNVVRAYKRALLPNDISRLYLKWSRVGQFTTWNLWIAGLVRLVLTKLLRHWSLVHKPLHWK
jgi:hypothetical protein